MSAEKTIITKFIPKQINGLGYESEADLERRFIEQLQEQGYEYAKDLKNEKALLLNLKKQLESLNECKFNENEWQRLLNEIIANKSHTILEKTDLIQNNYLHYFNFDNGTSKNIMLVDKQNLQKNHLQVINQYNSSSKNRYDVSILVNGLPLVHCELKRRGVKLKEAFNQIKRYDKESFFESSGLFNFVQIFIISNGTYTKYYSNTTRNNHLKNNNIKGNDSFEFTSYWADFENNQILDLVDFTSTFLAKHVLLNVLLKYCIFDTLNNLLVMRPYQIAATEAIILKIKKVLENKSYGSNKATGYIWHATGSGKTLTSFKSAQLASGITGVEKVIFVVDRKDLDTQTIKYYNKFQKDCVKFNKSTKKLEERLNDNNHKIIVTTIQKLSIFVKNNKGHALFQKPCVIIFDECHRSQFGQMNDLIKEAFKKYLLFGFTGTPIFDTNKTGDKIIKQENNMVKMGQTTDLIFHELLHKYTIANAIIDKNVLPFKVSYLNIMPNLNQNFIGLDYESLDERMLNHPERIKKIVTYILENFDKKTYRSGKYKTAQNKRINGFNSIFASSSIESAKLYYDEFKKQNESLEQKNKLKIALIFSYTANNDENIEDCEKLPTNSKEFLEKAIKDYNGIFGTNFDTSADNFTEYYMDISKRMKNKEIDMLIVVDMFLTGFNAETLNTLWVDKNLRYHGLLQAFSRTNRILDSTKQFGNIVCFRDLKQYTDESIILFSQNEYETKKVVLIQDFKEYFQDYEQIINELMQKFPKPQILETIKDKKAFIKTYNKLLKIENILNAFDEFSDDKKLIDEQKKQNFQGVYLQFKDEITELKEEQIEEILDDVSFEIELLKQVDINIDYIYNLLAKAKKASNENAKAEILENINMLVDASIKLRIKGDLIKEFSSNFINLTDKTNIYDENNTIDNKFKEFVKIRKNEELDKIIKDENLKEIETKKFMEKSFKNGEISDLGVEFREILPNRSLFDSKNAQKDEKIFRILKSYYEKYEDII